MKTTALTIYVLATFAMLNATVCASELSDAIEADYGRLDALFRHFHANPELSLQEFETSERLGDELEALGFTVTRNINETGLVGTMNNGDGPSLVIRADMDGLPVREDSGLEYASTVTQVNKEGIKMPVMHACGHDMHVTTLIGVAKQLANNKDKWQGTVHLVGQPAEEELGGAKGMVADGLYEKIGRPDFALALHVIAKYRPAKSSSATGSFTRAPTPFESLFVVWQRTARLRTAERIRSLSVHRSCLHCSRLLRGKSRPWSLHLSRSVLFGAVRRRT